jgi:hypothetical protein
MNNGINKQMEATQMQFLRMFAMSVIWAARTCYDTSLKQTNEDRRLIKEVRKRQYKIIFSENK